MLFRSQENFGRCPVLANAEEPGAKDARGVEHNGVARGNELLEIAELLVGDLACGSIDDHQPAVAAPRGRLLCDAIGGEIEVVVGGEGSVPGQSAFN